MAKTILQVPIDQTLRNQATAAAVDLGFSSLQETIRVFLKGLATKNLSVSFAPKSIKLSKRAAARYDKMVNDVLSGKVKTRSFTSVDKLMQHLNS